jgi:hypothetical protein
VAGCACHGSWFQTQIALYLTALPATLIRQLSEGGQMAAGFLGRTLEKPKLS